MDGSAFNKRRPIILSWFLFLGVPFALTYFIWDWFASFPDIQPRFFTQSYPASQKMRDELVYIRQTNRLHPENERRIIHASLETAKLLKVPPSLLWCLLFQESRLNHLLGLDGSRSSYGLGQFTHFGFYEINYQMHRYDHAHNEALVKLLGKDVRPILPHIDDPKSPSSYFSIPTAVVATGLYLRNRYLHLTRILEERDYKYDPQILWLYAAMAYNKGTRGILSFWNEQQNQGGRSRVKDLVLNKKIFFNVATQPRIYEAGFARIWSFQKSKHYSKELAIHLKNISSCALTPQKEIPQ